MHATTATLTPQTPEKRFVERMLSMTMTLELRGQDVLAYLTAAIPAHRKGHPTPDLN